jgi:uncharacterized protein YjiS (DUF1127 family)
MNRYLNAKCSKSSLSGPFFHASWWNHAIALISLWRERARQRRALAKLSDDDLKDLGLSRADVYAEGRKHFWQGPFTR